MSHQLDEERIFHTARLLPTPEAQSEYLEHICAGDQELQGRVEALLNVHEQESFLKSADQEVAATIDFGLTAEKAGATIGRYKLLQEIGEGGMGTVFMSEQTQPVSRRVALKIIKPGMDSNSVIARFEAERQALAMMDHPNIAKVLDAGTTNSGRPYFVMELVKGVPITEYCDDQKMPIRERLKLCIQVCQAVQHAHQKGIIHRDIKPSNVLVAQYDSKPVPKVIDFGVAKAVSQRLTERTMFTQFGQIVGTLEYMSPEQAQFNQLDVDTRSDIYSLGVLLYELLTGQTPIDGKRLRSSAFEEVLRILREEEPPKPSNRISTLGERASSVSASRASEPSSLAGFVRGDLDWIVMTALAKDRSRRYGAALALAEDIHRYLSDEPIVARPPTVRYRIGKFVKRNRRMLIGASLAVLVLLSSGFGLWFAAKSRRSETQVTHFIQEGISVQVLLGEFEKARKELEVSKQRFELWRYEMMNGQIDLLEGRNREAIDRLKTASRLRPQSTAIKAMLTLAYGKQGDEEEHFASLANLRNAECVDFQDHLFRGWACAVYEPHVAQEDLEHARQVRPTSLIAAIVQAEVWRERAYIELDSQPGLDLAKQAIDLLRSLRHFLPDNSAIGAELVFCYLIASDREDELGASNASKRNLELAVAEAEKLTPTSGHALHARANLFRRIGRNDDIYGDLAKSEEAGKRNDAHAMLAATRYFKEGRIDDAREALEKTHASYRTGEALFGFAYLELDSPNRKDLRTQIAKRMSARRGTPTKIYRIFDWTVYRLLGQRNEAMQAAEDAREAWVAGTDVMLGEKEPSHSISKCTNRFDLSQAHFFLGIECLANGEKDNAIKHFKKVQDLKCFRLYSHWWTGAFLQRLHSTKDWPKLVPK